MSFECQRNGKHSSPLSLSLSLSLSLALSLSRSLVSLQLDRLAGVGLDRALDKGNSTFAAVPIRIPSFLIRTTITCRSTSFPSTHLAELFEPQPRCSEADHCKFSSAPPTLISFSKASHASRCIQTRKRVGTTVPHLFATSIEKMFFLFDVIVFLIAISLSIAISVLISQPFNGAIVRLRANYLPKAVSLDNVLEDGAGSTSAPRALSSFLLSERRSTAKIGPVVTGVFSMMLRTKRLEGWAGIYKGAVPVAIQIFTLSTLTFIFFSGASASSPGSAYKAGPAGPGQFGFFSNLFYMLFVSLAALPLNVVTYRTIVHPRILPLSSPRENLRELLSYTEFTQPWRLYLLPGLLAANMLHVAWIGLATRIVRQVTVPSLGGLPGANPAAPGDDTYSGPNSNMLEISPVGLPIFVLWNVISVVVLAPLECAMVRLSTQRPERQNPLHRAYARVPINGAGAPSPYSHQATAAAQAQPGGAYSDADPTKSTDGAVDKPLPTSPGEMPGRPSFAIEDEDEAEEEDGDVGAAKPAVSESSRKAARVLGQTQPEPVTNTSAPATAPSGFTSQPSFTGGEPPEPVIALRPIEEQTAQEAAAEFGAPVVSRYEGLMDCFNKMVDEEGIESLGRGAWVTLVSMFAGSFS